MSCTITSALSVDCKEAVGGVKRVYVAANGIGEDLIESADWTEAAGVVSSIPATAFYTWNFHPEKCSLDIRVQASPDAGTIFYEQAVSLNVAHLDETAVTQLHLLAKGKPCVIVELNTGDLILIGARNGCDLTGGQLSAGTGFGDGIGITMELTAKEYDRMYFKVTPSAGVGTSGYPLDNLTGATITA